MKSFALSLLMAAPSADGQAAGPASLISTFIPFALIIAIFYFLIIRPQNKKQKETQKMLGNLKKGDRIVTIGGIHGVIQSVKEQSVIVKVDDAAKLEFSRSAISSVEAAGKEEKPEKAEKAGKIEDKRGDAAGKDAESGSAEQ
jgi:preprotein translocase subunit YajC